MAELILAILLAFFVHEGGHWMAARLFGKRLKFRFAWGRFYVPRLVSGGPCPTCQKASRESLPSGRVRDGVPGGWGALGIVSSWVW